MTRRIPLLLLALIILAPATGTAGETRRLTLDEALAVARQENRAIGRAAAYGDYVAGRYREERAAALPQLSLDAALTRSGNGSLPATSSNREGGLESVGVTLSQPLYTWGKIGAALRIAEVGLQTAADRERQARQAVGRGVTAAFYDQLLAEHLYRLAVEQLAQKERHLDEAQKKFAAGVATDYDVLAARVARDNARPEVIRAEQSVAAGADALALLLDGGAPVTAVGTLDGEVVAPPDEEMAVATARSRRPDLAEADKQVRIADELVTIARTGTKPRLDLRSGADWRRWSDATSDGQGIAWNAGVYFSFPFFDGWRTSGRVTEALSELRDRQLSRDQLADAITRDVRAAVRELRQSGAVATATAGTVEQARRLLALAEKGYEFGVKTRLDVDDAQLNLSRAESNLARARRDYLVARAQLDWAMGVWGEKGAEEGTATTEDRR